MQQAAGIGVADVQAVYDGAEGDLWELVMGEQIHIGGMAASMDLAERANIAAGSEGADLCCCNGAGMRFLVRFRGVKQMTGVDVTERIVGAAVLARKRRGSRIGSSSSMPTRPRPDYLTQASISCGVRTRGATSATSAP